jgi:transposase
MQAITTIGLDIAKSVFQVHGVDAEGTVIIRRKLKRRYVLLFFQKLSPRLVGIEACASPQSSRIRAGRLSFMMRTFLRFFYALGRCWSFHRAKTQSCRRGF